VETTVSSADDDAAEPGKRRRETLAAILLAIAAVATAWSSYQANRWNGEQAKAASQTNGIRIQAARAAGMANTQSQVDVATFIAWADADLRGEDDLAEFYENRYREEFRTAFDAWMATDPLTNPDAPPTPFAMPEYQVESRQEAERLDAESEASAAIVRRNIQRSSNYVLAVVLFAVALFFGGMSTRLKRPELQTFMLVCGYVIYGGALLWIALSPVSVGV
jgi:hypothetical protein